MFLTSICQHGKIIIKVIQKFGDIYWILLVQHECWDVRQIGPSQEKHILYPL